MVSYSYSYLSRRGKSISPDMPVSLQRGYPAAAGQVLRTGLGKGKLAGIRLRPAAPGCPVSGWLWAHGVRELQGFARAPRTEFPSRAPRTEVLRDRAQKKTEAFQFLRLLLVRAYLPVIR